MRKPGSANKIGQGRQRGLMELTHTHSLVLNDNTALPPGILCCNSGWTAVRMAGLRLHAAKREHEAARGIAPVSAEREDARHIETGHDPAARANANFLPQSDTDKTVVHQHKTFAQRRPNVVDKFQRRCASAAFGAIDYDEIGANSGFQHGLADRHEFPGMPDAELKADRLALRELTQARDEVHQFDRGSERRMPRRRDTIDAHRHAAGLCDLSTDLRAGQNPAMPGLGALRELDFDHLDLGRGRLGRKLFGAERTVVVPAAKIATAKLPNQIAPELPMIAAD